MLHCRIVVSNREACVSGGAVQRIGAGINCYGTCSFAAGKVDRALCLLVVTAEVKHQLAVNVDPNVVVSAEGEFLVNIRAVGVLDLTVVTCVTAEVERDIYAHTERKVKCFTVCSSVRVKREEAVAACRLRIGIVVKRVFCAL